MGLEINNIKNSEFRSIVAKYDTNGDNELSDCECAKLVFDFSKYTTEDNFTQMRDKFKRVVAETAGGNTPELIAQHMDRVDENENGIIKADTWNSYSKIYDTKKIRNYIDTNAAKNSLKTHGVGTEIFTDDAEDNNSSSLKDFLKYGLIAAGVGIGCLYMRKLPHLFKSVIKAPKVKAAKTNQELQYLQNQKNAFELLQKESKKPLNYTNMTDEKIQIYAHDIYKDLERICYDDIRYCISNPYKMIETCSKNISEVVSQATEKTIARRDHSGWYYRRAHSSLYAKKTSMDNCERLSLNVYPEKELIDKLDDYLAKTGINVEYKVPVDNEQWMIRHENIIMYFYEKITPQMEKDLIEIISPHVRKGNDSKMIGQKLAEGIFKEKEPTEAEVQLLVKRAEALNFDGGSLVSFLTRPGGDLYGRRGYTVETSPAIVKSIETLLDKLEKIKVN